MWGGKLVDPPGECRSNHEVICALAERLGAQHRGFQMSPREIVDWTLRESGRGTLDELIANDFHDVQPDFARRIISTASAIATRNSASSRIGRRCPTPMPARSALTSRCRRCPITGP
jgi:anaerobic selenocysteine-containing dehydrogenase